MDYSNLGEFIEAYRKHKEEKEQKANLYKKQRTLNKFYYLYNPEKDGSKSLLEQLAMSSQVYSRIQDINKNYRCVSKNLNEYINKEHFTEILSKMTFNALTDIAIEYNNEDGSSFAKNILKTNEYYMKKVENTIDGPKREKYFKDWNNNRNVLISLEKNFLYTHGFSEENRDTLVHYIEKKCFPDGEFDKKISKQIIDKYYHSIKIDKNYCDRFRELIGCAIFSSAKVLGNMLNNIQNK